MRTLQSKTGRQSRAAFLADETKSLMDDGDLQPAFAVDASAPLAPVGPKTLTLEIVSATSEKAAMGLWGDVGVLIFASSTRPGGGWRQGAFAQEEDVSLHSTWGYQAEQAAPGFYGDTQGWGPEKVLVADGGWLMHTDQYLLGRVAPVVFAAVAAPNRKVGAVRDRPKAAQIETLAKRLRTAFDVWQEKGVSTVVAGAIGCGVFQWKGEDSARAMRLALEASTWNGRLLLAMPDGDLALAFRAELGSLAGA